MRLPNRRQFLGGAGLTIAMAGSAACRTLSPPSASRAASAPARLVFVSGGKTVLMDAEGSGARVLEFDVPNQATWQPAGFFPDGRRLLLLSMEPRRDGPGRPFEEYYTQTPTHLWIYGLDSGSLEEIATRDRLAPFYTPQLLLPNGRLLVQVVRQRLGQILNMNLDGSDAVEFTRTGEGLPYGFDLHPSGQRVAFHLASPSGYQIWTSDLLGANRTLIASHPDHLYFGPCWSPDGAWLAFQACRYRDDPGHEWSDVWISRPDGSEQRALTTGQTHWFGATYGNPGARGGGSNLIAWTRAGSILFSHRLPGSRVAWEFQAHRPDTDHFNREYHPERARGGTEISRLDPATGTVTTLTRPGPGYWDFRASESPDGHRVVFCRAATGALPELWIMNAEGAGARLLTGGLPEHGADHPRWLPGPGANLQTS